MKVKDARNRKKYIKGGKVIKMIWDTYKDPIKTVVEVPTPTEEKPGDTRLYLGEDDSFDPVLRENMSRLEALEKWKTNPSDSLTRGQYEELIKEDIVKDDKKEKKKRRRKRKRG